MTLTNEQITSLGNGLQEMTSAAFPIEVAYVLLQNFNNIRIPYEKIFIERQAIYAKYGITQDSKPSQEDLDKANAELQELAFQTQDIELRPVKLKDFTGIKISMEALNAILPIIDGEG